MVRLFTLLLVFAVVFGSLPLIYGQVSYDSAHVVINELDINPPGDDAKSISEWVELYNPTSEDVDIGGWQIASTTVLKKTLTIPSGTIIKADQLLVFSYQSAWLTDVSEVVELRDKSRTVIDSTPALSDMANDLNSWQRTSDGFDTDSSSDWKFDISTAGASNGKIAQQIEQTPVTLTLSSDKTSYIFGETASISGAVSKQVFIDKPYFHQDSISVVISGPSSYKKTVTLYPDLNLGFKTNLNLQQILGVQAGIYKVSATYAGAMSETSFSVGTATQEDKETTLSQLTITTDSPSYIPGQIITITGTTTQQVPLTGLKFKVTNAKGIIISSGSLYPDSNSNFKTTLFLTTVNPSYGQYEIIAEYDKQLAHTTFEVSQDIKEDKIVSLATDKEFYAPGDTVNISGRLNKVWVNSLDLEIVQTKNIAITSGNISGGDFAFKILDVVRIAGDGTFSYSFQIPNNDNRLGDYRIKVSQNVGSASKSITVVSVPDEHVSTTDPLSLSTNKGDFDLGDTLVIEGKIANPDTRSSFETKPVVISISKQDGSPLEIVGLPTGGGAKTREKNGLIVAYEFTAIPDLSGRFSVTTPLSRLVFAEGIFEIKATYGSLSKSASISIIDPLKTDERIVASINKQVFGLNESVELTGLIPSAVEKGVVITVTKPDGTSIESGAVLDNSKFAWTWQTPISEVPATIKSLDDRSKSITNYGIYKIHIVSGAFSKNILFKVSSNPVTDTFDIAPLSVSTDKTIYRAGEKLLVLGDVILRDQGKEGLVIPDRITIQVLDGKPPFKMISESQVYANQGGHFESSFELPITRFTTGEYAISAKYSGKISKSSFSVVNDLGINSKDPISIIVNLDKEKYYPGDTVFVTGHPNKLVYLEKYDVSLIKKSDNQITCGTFFCGKHQGPVTTIRPNPIGSFEYEYHVPNMSDSIGSYEITVNVGFDTTHLVFDVVERSQEQSQEQPSVSQPEVTKTIEKFNRLSDANIVIDAKQKESDGVVIVPHLIQGSLVTIPRGEEPNVNLRIIDDSGQCIIGKDSDCLVSDNTRTAGSIYKTVTIDGMNYKVRYSGPSAEIEKFTIVTESSDGVLPDTTWHVEIQKDDQVSRFYYKINYLKTE